MKGMKKFLSLLLCMMMVIGMLPMSAFADETTDTVDLTAEFTEVQAFVDYLMDSNDPETVVKNFKTHFTWDNEKRENSKTTLFDWSYYNGVVFEGLEYLYENTKDEAYKNYVMEYMSSLIASDGSWAKCNNSTYTCSGYDATHGGDTIKTASLLLDAYEMSGDSRYLTMAATIYKDITTAAGTYSLPDAGYNLRHTWKSGDPAQDLWLDGLYMVLPFRAEYAKHIGDTEELDLIVDRLQWVSDNMYDSSKGLFYHAANSDTNNSGSYWLRSMGWYAAAIVDVMDSYADDLNSEDFIALKAQLKKLIDGLYGSASAENGYMWLNAPAFSYNEDNNPYETSGASLIYYAVMKAVNNGWLDEPYAARAISCFEYMVDKKLTNNVLTDICFKGAPSTSSSANSEFEDNEGKGVGPFIMLYAELLEYTNTITSIVVTPPTTVTYKIGDTLDTTGMEVYGVQRDGDKVDLTDKIVMDEIVLDEAGTQSITVTYNGMTATFEVTVEDVPVVDYNVTAKVEGTDALVEAVVVPTTKVAEKVASVLDTANLVAYDISVEGFEEGQTAEVTIPMPADVDATKFMVWYVGDDDTLEPMNGHPNADGTYTFTTTHFSVYVGGEQNDDAEVDEDNSKSASATVRQGMTTYTYVFSASPAEFELGAGETQDITYTVTRNNSSYTFDADDIDWSTNNSSIATVDNGVVTGVSAGTATITASISVGSSYSSRTLSLNLSVTVASRTIDDYGDFVGETVRVAVGKTPVFNNTKLPVTYSDTSTGVLTVGDGLTVDSADYDLANPGTYICDVYATGKDEPVGTVTVIVYINYDEYEEATTYPEYPADGAVRIKKTATEIDFENTGVAQVELDVAGISVKQGVNVLMIMDISNSMSWDDSEYDYNDTVIDPNSNQRLNIARASAKEFAKEMLTDNTGAATDNTLTVLAFAGIDGDYNDHSTAAANDDVYRLGALAMTDVDDANDALDDLVKATTGGTNYDYAFQQAYALSQQLHAENGKDVYIVFMTDGAPTHYNGVYYKSRNNDDLTGLMNYIDPTTGVESRYTSTGNDRNGNDIDSTATQTITVYYNDGTTATKNVTYNKGWSDYVINNKNGWAEKVKTELKDYVKHVYAIGFGMANGSVTQGATSSMPTLNNVNGGQYYIPSSTTHAVLSHMATKPESHFEADNQEALTALYKTLAENIKYAGTAATTHDIIDSDFTLQLTQQTGTGTVHGNLGFVPTITVKAYDLYTKEDTSDTSLIGARKTNADGSYIFTEIEVVKYNEDGTVTSNLKSGNIMTTYEDGTVVIKAEKFTYTKTADGVETFDWHIGNITDKEIALSFYVYLKGTLEGERPKRVYYTNEEATLDYIDINGKHANKVFPLPGVAWGGASTAYEFYLVNDEGQPCNRNGDVVPFENRITITGPYYEELYLNQEDEEIAEDIIAINELPVGYTLYDETAKYTVITASGDIPGSLIISEPADNKVQTTKIVSATAPSYIQSHVAFGVYYNMIPDEADFKLTPDKVVIDYGKPIIIDISNTECETGYTPKLIGFTKYYDSVDFGKKYTATTANNPFPAEYGTFTVENGENHLVRYTPTAMVNAPEKVVAVIEMTKEDDTYYMADLVTVIPATSVYYETDFADNVFAYTTTGTAWTTNSEGPAADGPQDDGTVGVGHYGFDSSYENDTYLSNGSSRFVEGQGVKLNEKTTKYTYVDFDFTGTGFDLISRTGAQQGAIRVNVYSDAARTKQVKSVTVLNKSESDLELYQIPVVSVHDLSVDPAHYYVRVHVNAAYSNEDYPALNRGGEFYFDAIRVYDPVDQDATDVKDAYLADGEYNYDLKEVRNLLIEAKTFDAIESGSAEKGMVFIDRTQAGVELATYTTIGPNNEVYLSKGQAIAFKISADTVPASIDVGAKSITGATAKLAAIITDTATAATSIMEIKSSTAQNIDLMKYIAVDSNNNSAIADGNAYVIITNTGEGVLSITDIKVAYGNATAATGIDFSVDANTLDVAFACLSLDPVEDTPEVPETPEEPEEIVPEEPEYVPNYDVLAAQFDSTKTRLLKSTTMTVVTTQDVESVTVTDKYGLDKSIATTGYVDNADGTRTWTVTVRPIMIGKQTYTVTGMGVDGTTGASATAKINVKLF